jgi:hypothetical protein
MMMRAAVAMLLLSQSTASAARLPSARGVATVRSHTALYQLRGGELAETIPTLESELDLDVVLEEAGETLVVLDFFAECERLPARNRFRLSRARVHLPGIAPAACSGACE